MKKTISIILAVTIIFSCLSIISVNAADYNAKITLNGSTYTYLKGSTVTYTCNLTVNDYIENGEFYLNYPSKVLEIANIEFPVVTDAVYNYEENLTDEMRFNFTKVSDTNDNSVLYNFKDGGALVVVTFNVINNGNGEISLDKVVLSNSNSLNALTKATFTETMSKSNYTAPKLNYTKRNLYVKKSFTLKMTGGSDSKITWKSSNTKIATVKNGKVVAKKAGTVKITATKDGVKKTCTVTVKNPTVKAQKTSIKVKKKTTITVKNAVGKTKFKALNKYAKVSAKGKVTGLKKGTAKIQVIASGVKIVIKIKIKK